MLKIEEKYLSDHQKQLREKCEVKYLAEKLCLTLNSKEKYVLDYRNLKQYLKLGIKLTKVHRVIKFQQSPWLREYIEKNTQFRQQARNKFEKDIYNIIVFMGRRVRMSESTLMLES